MLRAVGECLAFALVLCGVVSRADELALLEAAQSKIESGSFSRQDAAACERYAKTSKTNQERFLLLVASYQRRVLGYPSKSLDAIAPYVFEPAAYADWKKRNDAEYTKKLREYDREVATWGAASRRNPGGLQAPPVVPHDIQIDLPPPEEWRFDKQSVLFAIEGANCLCDVGKYQEALKIIGKIGQDTDTVGRIYAAESAGDVFSGMRMLKKALEMYDAARNFMSMHRSQFSVGEEDLRKVFESEIAVAAKRISDKRAKTLKLLEIEQYGPEWVLYKDAEVLRKEKRRFSGAFSKYRELSLMAEGTMFGDAAGFGIIGVFLSLADKDGMQAWLAEKTELEAVLVRCRGMRRDLALQAPSPSKLAQIDQAIIVAEQALKDLMALPTGRNAGAEVLRLAKDFLAANEFGLYRGEVLFALGNHYLESQYDVKAAIESYVKSKQWCDAAFKLDAKLNQFQIPEKSASVSAPPKTMKMKDAWGNIDWAIPQTGKLFNRRTAKWYLGYLRIMAGTKLALAYFIDGQKDAAIDELWVITAFDEIEKKQCAAGMPNSYSRLKRGFEDGRLFATQEDIRSFSGSAKIRLLTADYYYELEQWQEAKERYASLREDHYDKLNTTARAYLDLVQAHCAMLTEGRKAAFPLFQKFEAQYQNTPSWNRAMSVMFSYYQDKPETHDKAAKALWSIYTKMPDTDKGHHSLAMLGLFYTCSKQYDKAIEILTLCQTKCPEYKSAVESCLADAIRGKTTALEIKETQP